MPTLGEFLNDLLLSKGAEPPPPFYGMLVRHGKMGDNGKLNLAVEKGELSKNGWLTTSMTFDCIRFYCSEQDQVILTEEAFVWEIQRSFLFKDEKTVVISSDRMAIVPLVGKQLPVAEFYKRQKAFYDTNKVMPRIEMEL